MCVAVSAGLFDGAMNYAWNAAILQLRTKVRNFGLPIVAQILQSDFEEKNLLELQDSRLLELSLKLNLVGSFFLTNAAMSGIIFPPLTQQWVASMTESSLHF
jgi:hypothetical protein